MSITHSSGRRWNGIHDFLYGWCMQEVLVEGTKEPIVIAEEPIVPCFYVTGRESRRIVGYQAQTWLNVDIFHKTDEELDIIYQQVEDYKLTLPPPKVAKFDKITIPKIEKLFPNM